MEMRGYHAGKRDIFRIRLPHQADREGIAFRYKERNTIANGALRRICSGFSSRGLVEKKYIVKRFLPPLTLG